MPKGIVWPQEMRDRARRQGTALFAFGYQKMSGNANGGASMVCHTPALTEEEAVSLTRFLLELTANKKPLDRCVTALKKSLKNCKKSGGISDA